MPTALITGITGQDGSYLAELLLSKGYTVYGLVRRSSTPNTSRIEHLKEKIKIVTGDLSDLSSMVTVVAESNPDEFYNLAAQSFVAESWRTPYTTASVTALGVINCLEAIRKINPNIKFYQAGSSEQFGKVQTVPQNESTPWYPRSPYGCSKVFAHEIVRNYRESYGIHASVGIVFNHESERRGIEFVTRKITHGTARIKLGLQKKITLGNMDAKRDWGHAKDYVEAMWLILQQPIPGDFVVGSGEAHSVREFVKESFLALGMNISFSGEGINEKGYVNGELVLEISKEHFRPAEVDHLIADSSKAEKKLGWKRKISFQELINLMIMNDLKEEKIKNHTNGFKTEIKNNNAIEKEIKQEPIPEKIQGLSYPQNSILRTFIK